MFGMKNSEAISLATLEVVSELRDAQRNSQQQLQALSQKQLQQDRDATMVEMQRDRSCPMTCLQATREQAQEDATSTDSCAISKQVQMLLSSVCGPDAYG